MAPQVRPGRLQRPESLNVAAESPEPPRRESRVEQCLRRTGRDAGPASQARVTCGHARPTVIGRALRCRYGKKFELMASVTSRFFFLLSALSSATGRVTLFVHECGRKYDSNYFSFSSLSHVSFLCLGTGNDQFVSIPNTFKLRKYAAKLRHQTFMTPNKSIGSQTC